MRARWLLLLAVLAAGTAQAGTDRTSIGIGAEYFTWREYGDSGARLLKETGPRVVATLEVDRVQDGRWEYGFRGRLYSAKVDYDGQAMETGEPVATQTDYSGASMEMTFTRFGGDGVGGRSPWFFRFGFGLDAWRRNLLDSGAVSGYVERYSTAYYRFGPGYGDSSRWDLWGGIRLPFWTRETVGWSRFGYDDLHLEPQGDFSLFASLRYRMAPHWDLHAYYDSYRFKKSDSEAETINGVKTGNLLRQPESQQDTVGAYVAYRF